MQDFSERLTYLLGDRRIYPWASELGVSNGAAESMKKGNIPGSDILGIIRLRENVNLDWLLTGNGRPFIVEYCDSADALRRTLAWLIADQEPSEPFWLYFVTDEQRLTLVTRRPSLYEYKKKQVIYHDHRFFEVAVTSETISVISSFCHDIKPLCRLQRLSREQMDKLHNGMFGPYLLLGSQQTAPLVATHEELPSPDELLAQLIDCQPVSQHSGEVSVELMRSVIQCVESTALEEGIELDSQQRARVFTAVYRHAQRSGLTSQDIDVNNVRSVLEVI